MKLREYLDDHGLSAYRLMREARGISPNSIYAYAANRRKPSIHNLERLLAALERLTGKPVSISDLLEYRSTPEREGAEQPGGDWRELVGLLDDPAFGATSVAELEQDLNEAHEQELRDSLSDKR